LPKTSYFNQRAKPAAMPEKLEAQLRAYLAIAEANLGKARRAADAESTQQAIRELCDVQIALGMGDGAQVPSTDKTKAERIRCTIFSLLRHRAPSSSICPSEVARVIGSAEAWRALMPATRTVAQQLATDNLLTVTRGDEVLDPNDLGRGPIRLRRGRLFSRMG